MATIPLAGGWLGDTDYDRWKLEGPDDDGPGCACCGDEGLVELEDHPELWGEDCFVEENRLVTCPECGGLPTAAKFEENNL